MTDLTQHFESFRKHIIGNDISFETPFGTKPLIYADWTASGRNYSEIEKLFSERIMPFVGNTHTRTSITGCLMTEAYNKAKVVIKNHVNSYDEDVLISSNSGMTGVVNKFQRILGLKVHEKHFNAVQLPKEERPIIFVTHMEHHSNQTSWIETLADVEIIQADSEGLVDLNHLAQLLEQYKTRPTKYAAVTSCSNVTGVFTPYHTIAKMMHQAGGKCFVDFACSAPYIDINMRPEDAEEHLDAIFFSPHKFLGGPGSSGILIFCPTLYNNKIPDNPGGGTVDWTNPWGEHKYLEHIESREDGGTPSFLQTMRVAFCCQLKEQMGVENILKVEKEQLQILWDKFDSIDNLHVLAAHIKERLGVISFYIDDLHYNLGVKLLNDRYGIQVRGGCSCAGTYGHYLLEVSHEKSNRISGLISSGDLSQKPGWIRMSIHPTMSNDEIHYIANAIESLSQNHEEWVKDYNYDEHTNEFLHKLEPSNLSEKIRPWFEVDFKI